MFGEVFAAFFVYYQRQSSRGSSLETAGCVPATPGRAPFRALARGPYFIRSFNLLHSFVHSFDFFRLAMENGSLGNASSAGANQAQSMYKVGLKYFWNVLLHAYIIFRSRWRL